MEKLKTVHSTASAEVSTAGTATYPEVIEVSTRTPGRSIDDNVDIIKIQKSWHFYDVKNQSLDDGEEKARLLYLNGADQGIMPTNTLPPHPETRRIHLPLLMRKADEANTELIPKTHSIGGIIQFSNRDTLPQPNFLLGSLLLEDEDHEAATAAFFLTHNDKLYKIARSSRTPQFPRTEMNAIVRHYKHQLELQKQEVGLDETSARESVLQVMANEFDLHFYSGLLSRLRLYKSKPQQLKS